MNGTGRYLNICTLVLTLALGPMLAGSALSANSDTEPGAKSKTTDSELVTLVSDVLGVLKQKKISYKEDTIKTALLSAIMTSLETSGSVYTEAQYNQKLEQHQGWFRTPGFWLTRNEGEYRIGGMLPDRTIEGLEPGNTLLSVEGQDVDSLSLTEVQKLLRSQDREKIALMIRNKKDKVTEVEAKYSRIRVPAIYASEPLNDSLGYLRLNGVYEGAGKDVAKALQSWVEEHRYGLVLDLRGAGGDNIQAVADIAGLFAKKDDLLFTFRDQNDQDLVVHKAGDQGPIGLPVMVLIDHDTSEAAELLAAVLKGSAQGVLMIGEPTTGHLMVREKMALSSGELLVLPTKRLILARGPTYDGRTGIEPNLLVNANSQDYEYEPLELAGSVEPDAEANQRLRNRLRGDPALKRATDVLLGLKALNIQTREPASN